MSETSNPASRYVIIGNGVAGTTAAETIRKADADAVITILADEPYPLYNRIALPRVLKQTTLPERTIIRQVAWHAQQRIDLRLETTVSRLDTDDRVVFTADGAALPYDKLLIATGGHAEPAAACPAPSRHRRDLQLPDPGRHDGHPGPIHGRQARHLGRRQLHRLRADRSLPAPQHPHHLAVRGPRFLHRISTKAAATWSTVWPARSASIPTTASRWRKCTPAGARSPE